MTDMSCTNPNGHNILGFPGECLYCGKDASFLCGVEDTEPYVDYSSPTHASAAVESITWNGHELSKMKPGYGGRRWFSFTGPTWRASVTRMVSDSYDAHWYAVIDIDDVIGASATDLNSPTDALDMALAEVEQQSVAIHRAVSAMQGQR